MLILFVMSSLPSSLISTDNPHLWFYQKQQRIFKKWSLISISASIVLASHWEAARCPWIRSWTRDKIISLELLQFSGPYGGSIVKTPATQRVLRESPSSVMGMWFFSSHFFRLFFLFSRSSGLYALQSPDMNKSISFSLTLWSPSFKISTVCTACPIIPVTDMLPSSRKFTRTILWRKSKFRAQLQKKNQKAYKTMEEAVKWESASTPNRSLEQQGMLFPVLNYSSHHQMFSLVQYEFSDGPKHLRLLSSLKLIIVGCH